MKRLPSRRRTRRGSVLILTALLLVFMVGIVAMAVDLGYLAVARSELQRTADAAAMAACWDLIDQGPLGTPVNLTAEIQTARQTAAAYAALNPVCNSAPVLSTSESNSPDGDVVIGQLVDPSVPGAPMVFSNPNLYNAVQVTVRRTSSSNGEVPLFFARVFGQQSKAVTATATAALLNNIGGFTAPSDGSNLEMLPFALDEETWNNLLAGGGSDLWRYNEATGTVASGADGIREMNLYPQGTGSPGNRGTVDIGSSNNSTADIARQILYGVTASDLAYHGGTLRFDAQGFLYLNGDTGISAGVKDELTAIIGKPRILPVFRSVTNPGNNATYQIVTFVGVRILEVKLTGSMSSKRVTIQPARVITHGAIPATGGTKSYAVYSPVWLVR
jgi:Flp pilus assembly protein TadG